MIFFIIIVFKHPLQNFAAAFPSLGQKCQFFNKVGCRAFLKLYWSGTKCRIKTILTVDEVLI